MFSSNVAQSISVQLHYLLVVGIWSKDNLLIQEEAVARLRYMSRGAVIYEPAGSSGLSDRGMCHSPLVCWLDDQL